VLDCVLHLGNGHGGGGEPQLYGTSIDVVCTSGHIFVLSRSRDVNSTRAASASWLKQPGYCSSSVIDLLTGLIRARAFNFTRK
jgi:hypothetical protein